MKNWSRSTKNVDKSEPKDDQSDAWKQIFGPKNMKDLDCQPVKLETESLSDEDRSDIKQPSQLDKMNKPLWFEINRSEFNELTRNIDNNHDNNDFKFVIKKRSFDLKKKNGWKKLQVKSLKVRQKIVQRVDTKRH